MQPIKKLRGEHPLNIYISYEMKRRLTELSHKHDCTMADMVRSILKVGIPVMEGLSRTKEIIIREYMELFRDLHRILPPGK